MNLFDILGPIMVGPSSSHTAGAVRIGYAARRLLCEEPVEAEILLHGSFASTGQGHGTDRALVAGLLGMQPDDERIKDSLHLAKKSGFKVRFGTIKLKNAHPNTTLLKLTGQAGTVLEVEAASLGGGRIQIRRLDGLQTNFTGDYPTLLIRNTDQPGAVARVTALLSDHRVNIASMQLYRDIRGGIAAMVIESDQRIQPEIVEALGRIEGIVKAAYLELS